MIFWMFATMYNAMAGWFNINARNCAMSCGDVAAPCSTATATGNQQIPSLITRSEAISISAATTGNIPWGGAGFRAERTHQALTCTTRRTRQITSAILISGAGLPRLQAGIFFPVAPIHWQIHVLSAASLDGREAVWFPITTCVTLIAVARWGSRSRSKNILPTSPRLAARHRPRRSLSRPAKTEGIAANRRACGIRSGRRISFRIRSKRKNDMKYQYGQALTEGLIVLLCVLAFFVAITWLGRLQDVALYE